MTMSNLELQSCCIGAAEFIIRKFKIISIHNTLRQNIYYNAIFVWAIGKQIGLEPRLDQTNVQKTFNERLTNVFYLLGADTPLEL